jgi:hypothetical protein
MPEDALRELAILDIFNNYDLVRSSWVYALTENYQSSRACLTKLDAGHYIGLPEVSDLEEENSRRAKLLLFPRNRHYPRALKDRGRKRLREEGRLIRKRGVDPIKHMLMRSDVEISIDVGARQHGLRIVGSDDILNHKNCPKETRLSRNPWRISNKPAIVPDITRGFSYDGNFAFVHIEVDRGTENLTVGEHDEADKERQSLKTKIIKYEQYLTSQGYYQRYGIPPEAAPTILIVTLKTEKEQRKEHIKQLVRDFAPDWQHRFAFTSVAKNPEPTGYMLEPWETTTGTMDIIDIIGGTRGQTRDSEEGGRAIGPDQGEGDGARPTA